MLITCQFCAARVQLDESKLPAHAFAVRCPKCQKTINVQPPGSASVSPAAEPPTNGKFLDATHLATPTPAPLYRLSIAPEAATADAPVAPIEANDLAQALALLLRNGTGAAPQAAQSKTLKTLVCADPAHSDSIAQLLANEQHQVYVAADAVQALKRLRRDPVDVVVLDANFDAKGQGAVFVTRAIGGLQPSERRNLFVVHVSAAARSADTHAAFLQSANLIVHPGDLAQLPRLIEHARRDCDELYRTFKTALSER